MTNGTIEKSEADIAADLKGRMIEALKPVCALMDEAMRSGMAIEWSGLGPQPPAFRVGVVGLRVTKTY